VTPRSDGGSLDARPGRGHHGDVGKGGDGTAVHHVAKRDVGGVPGHPQSHLVGVEYLGDDAELGDEW
jgi:hypothetical protein